MMHTVRIYTDKNDAEKLAVILLRSEVNFYVEHCCDDGFMFTVSENSEDDEV